MFNTKNGKYHLITLFLFLFVKGLFSQILNLPPRNYTALNGAQFVNLVTSMNLTDRENEIYNQVLTGNVPDFQRNLVAVTNTESIGGTSYTFTYYVLPDYLAIGHDTNYFLCPMTPLLAQRIANAIGCTMPTRKMVNQIWTAAPLHLSPSSIPPSPQMTTIPVMAQHNTTVWGQRSAVLNTYPLGFLVGGDKKDVVISNMIYGYPPPGRVVIYGWHYTSGSPIQPLYNGHEETYADYSHGIRLVQNSMVLNGNTTTVTSVLQSSSINSLLSDEGIIATPSYPVNTTAVSVPTSFAVVNEGAGQLRILASPQADVTHFLIQTSFDGIAFSQAVQYHTDSLLITGLNPNQVVFIKIAAKAPYNTSCFSEVLGAVLSDCNATVLIVNAFDRPTTENTFDFIRQHGKAFHANGFGFVSCTNEALTNGLVAANQFRILVLILGEESTANETFCTAEQIIVTDFLKQGGCLFVSGAEIAWDLDHLGSASDKDFYNNYLKATYVNDAPNGQNGVYYTSQPTTGSIFAGLGTVNFDNGTNGTYNVRYPDVLSPAGGAVSCLEYSTLTANYAGIVFNGMFPSGTLPGKLVNMGIPFETFYPEIIRTNIMGYILNFFDIHPSGLNKPFISQSNDTLFSDWNGLQQWYYNNTPIIGATSNFIIPDLDGDYYVIAQHGACYSDTSDVFHVTFTEIIKNHYNEFVKIYPNPFINILNINVENSEAFPCKIRILNSSAQEVFNEKIYCNKSLTLEKLPKGLYFFTIECKHTVFHNKIIKF